RPVALRPGDARRHGVAHGDVEGARPDHHVGDLQPLFTVVGLRHQQLVDVHAQGTSICGIERVLGVDEDGDASVLLGLRDDVKTNRGLARSLRAEDLDDPTPRDPPDPERHVEITQTPCPAGCSPSRMIAPLPYCRSICDSVTPSILSRSIPGTSWTQRAPSAPSVTRRALPALLPVGTLAPGSDINYTPVV